MEDAPEEEDCVEMEEGPTYDPWVETYVVCESASWLHRNAWNVNNLYSRQSEMAALVDFGASGTVCGIEWLKTWAKSAAPPPLSKSGKRFRFGDGIRCASMGVSSLWVELKEVISNKPAVLAIRCDVVAPNVPMLLSLPSLKKLKGKIDCDRDSLSTEIGEFRLKRSKAGHLLLGLQPKNGGIWGKSYSGSVAFPNICDASSSSADPEIADTDGEAADRLTAKMTEWGNHEDAFTPGARSVEAIKRICRNAGALVPKGRISAAAAKCRCDKKKYGFERPIIRSNASLKSGARIALDIYYPAGGAGMRKPFLLPICALTRYTMMAALSSHQPGVVIDAFFRTWFQGIGKPQGTAFSGPQWAELSDVFDIEHVMASTNCPNENGSIERAVSLIKIGFKSIKAMCPDLKSERIANWACVAKNLTPMIGSGICPAQAMHGRSSMFESLENRQLANPSVIKDVPGSLQLQLQAALKARGDIAKYDARRTLGLGMNRPIRAGSAVDFKMNDGVVIFAHNQTQRESKWLPVYRVVGGSSHHVVVEKGSGIFRHPKYLTRLSTDVLIQEKSDATNATPTPTAISIAKDPSSSNTHRGVKVMRGVFPGPPVKRSDPI